MGIFRSLGFGLFLIVILFLMPNVFAELSQTLVTFLQSSRQAFTAAGTLASHADDSFVSH